MKRIVLSGVFVFSLMMLNAQQKRNCATHKKYLEAVKNDPSLLQKRLNMEEKTQQWINNNYTKKVQNKSHVVITIPVVVHVLHESGTPAQNISDAQIQTQLVVMNDDYRRLNADTTNTPAPFKSLGADCEINFCLAKQDEMGNPVTGITRTQTTVNEVGNSNDYYKTATGGMDIWDPGKYLNIWVCEIDASGSTFGFAYLPGTAPAGADGVVIDYRFFGTISTVSAPFHLGRTVTHEIGHWFNLEHIWGDADCGNDFVTDTPKQKEATSGCHTFPYVSACSAGGNNAPNGDMYHNYMDYSDDNCMNIFTIGQKARIWAALNNSRNTLFTSVGCVDPNSVPEKNTSAGIAVYPNPGNGNITVDLHDNLNSDITLKIYSILGEQVKSMLMDSSSAITKLNVSDLTNGIYILEFNTGKGKTIKKLTISK